jgi:quinol monooxygenase YgiN
VIGIEILIRVAESKRVEFRQLCLSLSSLARPTGCVVQSAFEEASDSGHFLWMERWADEAALNQHLDSERHHTLLGAIRVLGSMEDMRVVHLDPAASES